MRKKKGSNRYKKGKSRKVILFPLILFFIILGTISILLLSTPGRSWRLNLASIDFEEFHKKGILPPQDVQPQVEDKEKSKDKVTPKAHPIVSPPPAIIPKVSIIIDDMGYHKTLDKKFILLDQPLSFAFLPYGPFSKAHALLAHKNQKDVLLHIPMEPVEKNINPGPGLLCLSMSSKEILDILRDELRAIPYIIGANNHMGSLFTTNRRAMDTVLLELKRHNLFFVDSRTTKDSIAYLEAISIGIPALNRNVFIDYKNSKKIIQKELERLVNIAKKKGFAVGIGHPFDNTFKILQNKLPIIKKEIELVPISRLILHKTF